MCTIKYCFATVRDSCEVTYNCQFLYGVTVLDNRQLSFDTITFDTITFDTFTFDTLLSGRIITWIRLMLF